MLKSLEDHTVRQQIARKKKQTKITDLFGSGVRTNRERLYIFALSTNIARTIETTKV